MQSAFRAERGATFVLEQVELDPGNVLERLFDPEPFVHQLHEHLQGIFHFPFGEVVDPLLEFVFEFHRVLIFSD